ncbi:hypothetical protein ACJQWK_09366 [Exserohilum turcicum]
MGKRVRWQTRTRTTPTYCTAMKMEAVRREPIWMLPLRPTGRHQCIRNDVQASILSNILIIVVGGAAPKQRNNGRVVLSSCAPKYPMSWQHQRLDGPARNRLHQSLHIPILEAPRTRSLIPPVFRLWFFRFGCAYIL